MYSLTKKCYYNNNKFILNYGTFSLIKTNITSRAKDLDIKYINILLVVWCQILLLAKHSGLVLFPFFSSLLKPLEYYYWTSYFGTN